jgi:hypothetical protein
MGKCYHKSCGREYQEWLPIFDCSDIARHPWCINCGQVKNITDDRGKKLGYWMNILSKLELYYSIKQIQKRFIGKELKDNEEFNDIYGITGSFQKELFKKIIKKYCNIDIKIVDSLIY